MKKIKLYNRDGADLWLENTGEQVDEYIDIWELKVDSNHKYVLNYCRLIGDILEPEAIDPSGGPMLSVGDVFENKYKILRINSTNNIWISEGDYNNQKYS